MLKYIILILIYNLKQKAYLKNFIKFCYEHDYAAVLSKLRHHTHASFCGNKTANSRISF